LRSRPLEEKAAAIRAFEREVVPGLASGRLRPLIDSVYPAKDVTAAFDRLASRGKTGKVLLEFTA
jgi:NADPH:quinone reductase-like Zn-dependent oxidoreductase